LKNDIKYLLQNSGLTFFLRILGMGLGYLIAIYISKLYGADVYGRYSILVTFAQFSVMLFSLGLPTAIVKLTSEAEHFNKLPITNYLNRSIIVLVISGIIGSIIIYSTSSLLGYNLFHDNLLSKLFKYLSYFFIFMILHNFGAQFFSGRKKFLAYGLNMFIFPNILFFVFIFIFRSLNLVTEFFAILSYILSLTSVGIYLLFNLPIKKVYQNYPYKNLLKLSLPILFSSAFLFISNWTDIFMLGSMVSKSEVGVYSAAYKLATISLLIILTVNIVIAPKIAELYNQNKSKQLSFEVRRANQLMTLLTLPIVIGLIVFRKFLLGLFGLEFLSGELALILLSIGFLFNAFSGTVSHILNMTDYQRIFRNLTLAMAILNIGLNYILIPKFGINGAALASLFSQLFLNVFAVFYVKINLGFWALL
jgi:O-antigen/teichoic acid export membrane protein